MKDFSITSPNINKRSVARQGLNPKLKFRNSKSAIHSHICILMSAIQPYINEQFNGDIWRIEIDEISDTLVAEIRSSADKQVAFASISLVSGKTYFKNFSLPERWLTGVEAAFDGVLLLHNYQSEAGPMHKGLVAVDVFSGQVLWSNYTLAFDHLSVEGPIVYDLHIHPRRLFLADVKTGATKRVFEPSVYQKLPNNIVIPVKTADWLTAAGLPVHPCGETVYCLDYNNFRIVSLHALKAEVLTQLIFITHGGYIVYQDILNAGIQKLQPEAFIMHNNRLIYIKNKSELKVLTM